MNQESHLAEIEDVLFWVSSRGSVSLVEWQVRILGVLLLFGLRVVQDLAQFGPEFLFEALNNEIVALRILKLGISGSINFRHLFVDDLLLLSLLLLPV